jgi:hypothetical protein
MFSRLAQHSAGFTFMFSRLAQHTYRVRLKKIIATWILRAGHNSGCAEVQTDFSQHVSELTASGLTKKCKLILVSSFRSWPLVFVKKVQTVFSQQFSELTASGLTKKCKLILVSSFRSWPLVFVKKVQTVFSQQFSELTAGVCQKSANWF